MSTSVCKEHLASRGWSPSKLSPSPARHLHEHPEARPSKHTHTARGSDNQLSCPEVALFLRCLRGSSPYVFILLSLAPSTTESCTRLFVLPINTQAPASQPVFVHSIANVAESWPKSSAMDKVFVVYVATAAVFWLLGSHSCHIQLSHHFRLPNLQTISRKLIF